MRLKVFHARGAVDNTSRTIEEMVNEWLDKNPISPETSIIRVVETPMEDDEYHMTTRTVYIFYVPMYPI